ncbi:MAG: response regulator [Cyclobacteriaceae bacterium]
MDKIKILIVEDEMIIAESISDMLEDLGYEVTDICIRATTALNRINELAPDLALFDIQLKGEETGLWLADQIKDRHDFPFIFLTSYGDKKTIDQAVNLSPYGYLLKPVEKAHLYSAIEVGIKRFTEKQGSEESDMVVVRDSFFVKEDYQYVKVNVNDIHYVKTDNNYIEIYTHAKRHIIRSTMKDFLSQIDPEKFLQVHRSYVVNLSRIEAFSSTSVKIGDFEVPIVKKYVPILTEHLHKLN